MTSDFQASGEPGTRRRSDRSAGSVLRKPPPCCVVVIVTHQSARYLPQLLADLKLAGSQLALEVLVVDNASTDEIRPDCRGGRGLGDPDRR